MKNYPIAVIKSVWRRLRKPSRKTIAELQTHQIAFA